MEQKAFWLRLCVAIGYTVVVALLYRVAHLGRTLTQEDTYQYRKIVSHRFWAIFSFFYTLALTLLLVLVIETSFHKTSVRPPTWLLYYVHIPAAVIFLASFAFAAFIFTGLKNKTSHRKLAYRGVILGYAIVYPTGLTLLFPTQANAFWSVVGNVVIALCEGATAINH